MCNFTASKTVNVASVYSAGLMKKMKMKKKMLGPELPLWEGTLHDCPHFSDELEKTGTALCSLEPAINKRTTEMAEGHMTTDHEKIRKWAEARGGKPATVAGTAHKKEDAGILRLDFEPKDEKLDPISWDEFFNKFEESHLAFLYQDKTADGSVSRFHKFVERQ